MNVCTYNEECIRVKSEKKRWYHETMRHDDTSMFCVRVRTWYRVQFCHHWNLNQHPFQNLGRILESLPIFGSLQWQNLSTRTHELNCHHWNQCRRERAMRDTFHGREPQTRSLDPGRPGWRLRTALLRAAGRGQCICYRIMGIYQVPCFCIWMSNWLVGYRSIYDE